MEITKKRAATDATRGAARREAARKKQKTFKQCPLRLLVFEQRPAVVPTTRRHHPPPRSVQKTLALVALARPRDPNRLFVALGVVRAHAAVDEVARHLAEREPIAI